MLKTLLFQQNWVQSLSFITTVFTPISIVLNKISYLFNMSGATGQVIQPLILWWSIFQTPCFINSMFINVIVGSWWCFLKCNQKQRLKLRHFPQSYLLVLIKGPSFRTSPFHLAFSSFVSNQNLVWLQEIDHNLFWYESQSSLWPLVSTLPSPPSHYGFPKDWIIPIGVKLEIWHCLESTREKAMGAANR